jgi:hypothetical protein
VDIRRHKADECHEIDECTHEYSWNVKWIDDR